MAEKRGGHGDAETLGWDDAGIEQLISFVSMAGIYYIHIAGLQLEPDVTPEVVNRMTAFASYICC